MEVTEEDPFLPGGWQGPAGSPATSRLSSLQEVQAVESFPLEQDLQDEWQSVCEVEGP